MATADEILATMAEEAAATDQMAEVCTIDRCTRAVTIPEALRIVGVETDKDVTRRVFRVLCSYRGTNLSTFRIRIHFMNANKEKDIYYVTDAAQDGEYLTFSWVISRNATKYKGKLKFIACMVCDGGTDEEREWNSTLGEFTVLEGLEVELTDGEEEQARDAITQLLAVIDARESEAVEAVSAQGATQVAAVRAAGAQQETSIAAKGAATLETIPDDYATLHNNVAALTGDMAKTIKGSVAVGSADRFVEPYNDMNTLPAGQVVTYIGREYRPANLPSGFRAKTDVFTVMTFNYNNAKFGGSVQVVYTTDTCYWRTASTETAYSAWVTVETPARLDAHLTDYNRQTIKGYAAIGSADRFVEPYNDMNTLPAGQVVTYIGKAYYPANLPSGFRAKTDVFTVMTFNYNNAKFGGSVQVIYATDTCYWRTASTETEYSEWVTLYDATKLLDAENLMPLFETVGVIGDSYSSGAVSVNGVVADHYPISWGQIMARRNGITCTNFSAGGLTTRTWLTHSKGAALLQSENAKKLYILALGINDNALLGSAYLGTAADIKMSDYTKNPDTFYGNYGRIIAMIKEKAPNAKIVISTMAPSAPGNKVAAYNAAIEEIAGLMGIPLLVQGDDHYFVSDLYKNNIVNNHPLASGYAHMAAAFERMICKAMNAHQDYFADYIG